MKVEMRKVADLVPYERNAKMHNETQIKNVAESIKRFGFVQPVVIDGDGVIVIGHCRTEAAKLLEMDEVPCVCVDDLTEEQVKALRIVDNKANESPWDVDLLDDELDDINFNENFPEFDFDFETDDLMDSFDDEFEAVSDITIDTFQVTLQFQNSDRDSVEAYIKKIGKDTIVQRITEEAIAYA